MFQTLVTTVVAVASFLSVMVSSHNGVTKVVVNQSTSSASPIFWSSPSATPTISPIPTPDQKVIEQQVQDKINQATASAQAQLDKQKTEAINQVNQQFDQANQQLEDQKQSLGQQASGSGMSNLFQDQLTKMEQQLDSQRQDMLHSINQSFNLSQ